MAPAPTETVWKAHPHTVAKQRILGKYWAGWMPTLTVQGYRGRVVIIDGFCGPGEYEDGEEGSPIVALRTYLEHSARDRMEECEFLFAFIDTRADRLEYLEKIAIPKLGPLPDNVKVHIVEGPFDKQMTALLDDLQQRGASLAPTFAFVDPFGVSGTPMSVIHRILEHRRSEVLITVMLEAVNRFLEHPNDKLAERWDELFEDPGWRALTQLANRLDVLGNFYAEQLKKNARFVTSFRMVDDGNRPIYDMFFATNHLAGLKLMKRAMWAVDPTGHFRFSDRYIVGANPALFEEQVNTMPLRRALLKQFGGQTVPFHQIEEWVLTETIYHDGHIRRKTLKPMETDGLIEFVPGPFSPVRRRGTFPDGCQIRFL